MKVFINYINNEKETIEVKDVNISFDFVILQIDDDRAIYQNANTIHQMVIDKGGGEKNNGTNSKNKKI